jgi:MFS family permease
MLCLGTVYSWSLFARPLAAAFQWSNLRVSMVFAVTIFALGWGAVFGGRWQDRVGPRVVSLTGVVLWGLGNLLAGLGTARFGYGWLLLTYGVLGGFGNGIAYITPVATVTKWFPERRGLAGGVVIMGFGLGAVVFSGILAHLPSFDVAARNAALDAAERARALKAHVAFDPARTAFTAADLSAVLSIFVGAGIAFLVLGGLCATLLRDPPAETARRSRPSSADLRRSYSPGEVLRTPQFYLLWMMLFINVTSGSLIISNAVPIFSELTGATPAASASIYGALSLFNGVGRFFWGWVSDKSGRNRAYLLIFGVQALVFCGMGALHSPAGVGVAFAVVLLCFGGGFGTMPSFNADYFGTTYLGANYGMILTAWGCAGLVGPLVAGFVKDRTGSFTGALLPVAGSLIAATLFPLFARRPRGVARAVEARRDSAA